MIELKEIAWCLWNAEDRNKVDIIYWDGSEETINENWDTFKSKINRYWKEHGRGVEE